MNEISGGSFTITVHEGTLSPAREILDNLSIGAFELGHVVSSYHPGKNPLISLLDLPFLPIETMQDRVEISERLHEHPAVNADFGRWNSVPVMTVVQPNHEIMGKGTPPTGLDALAGKRMKATSGIGDALAHYGVALVPMTGAERYNGLQTGVIDSVAATPSAHGGWRLYELSDRYTVGMDAGTAHVTLVASAGARNALSDDHCALLQKAEDHACARTVEAQSGAADDYAPILEAAGLERTEVTGEMPARLREEAAQPVRDAYVAEAEGHLLPAQEVRDPILSHGDANVLIFGTGRTGSAGYAHLERHGFRPPGLDADTSRAKARREAGLNGLFADAEDRSFRRGCNLGGIEAAILAMDDPAAKPIAA